MPLALHPNQTYRISLICDRDLPEESRPEFEYRFLTYAESIEYSEVLDAYQQAAENRSPSIQQAADAVRGLAGRRLVGWYNLIGRDGEPVLFDRERLGEVCNFAEMLELVHRQMTRQTPDVEDKKKSDWPSPTDTADSAKPAPGPDSAPTHQP
jgi:hypothetical protein